MKLRDRRSGILYSRWLVRGAFRWLWVLSILWYELGVYYLSLSSCKWPTLGPSTEKPTHLLLLSDTQLTNAPYGRNIVHPKTWRRFLSDLNLRKNWRITSRLKPHAVMFLGDMLASGRTFKSAKEFGHAVQVFKSVFTLPGVPMYFIPGNTDVSLGMGKKHSKDVKDYFTRSFGPLNQEISIHNHTFVALDAPGLVDEDYHRAAQDYDDWEGFPDGPITFVRSVDAGRQPLILFSHIPLSRPSTASCGPLRERGIIHRTVGHGYQSMLGKQTTQFLLKTLKPSLIFSGDNRDYCDYTHSYTMFGSDQTERLTAREVTVKSFSMSRHIRMPGFQLLSLVNPTSTEGSSFADAACHLPDQGRIYSTVYPTLLALTLLMLFIINQTKIGRLRRNELPVLHISSPNPDKSSDSAPLTYTDGNPWTPWTGRSPLTPKSPFHSISLKSSVNGHYLRNFSAQATSRDAPSHYYTPHSGVLDEEEALYPVYSPHHLHHERELQDDEEWASKQEGKEASNPVPGWKPVEAQKWSWSWTFVFRARRRRVTLSIPSWRSLATCYELCGGTGHGTNGRGLVMTVLLDLISVLWPAWLTWLVIVWFQF